MSKTTGTGEFKVLVKFGEVFTERRAFAFQTEAERAAFLLGVEATAGFLEAEPIEQWQGEDGGVRERLCATLDWVDGGMEGPCPACGLESGFHTDEGECEDGEPQVYQIIKDLQNHG